VQEWGGVVRIQEVVDRQTAETLMAMARSTETRARQGDVLVEHAHSSNHTFTSLKGFWRPYDTLVCLVTDRIVEMVAGFRKSRKVNIRWIEELIEGDQLEAICEAVREDYASGRKLDAFLRER